MSSQLTGSGSDETTSGEFGANEWLVDELYERYLVDKKLVDESWWPVLESYHQTANGRSGGSGAPADSAPAVEAPADEAPAGASSAGAASAVSAAPAGTPAASAEALAAPAEPAPTTASIPVVGGQRTARTTSSAPKPVPVPADMPITTQQPTAAEATEVDVVTPLRGMSKSLAANMATSLTVPTATSVRTIPAKLLIDNRIVMNNHMKRSRGGKVSFTHLIGWALIQALKMFPSQNVYYNEIDGKPSVIAPAHVGLGIAIDLPKPDGTRSLMVPAIKRADTMTFGEYLSSYEDLVTRARKGKLTADDFSGATVSLTNPGGIGTVHSVPRLMKGQGCI
ncbi:MAG TPA: 2-oxo acid dehydrogenase subunit E2, partial [Cryobacterium sp.]|nr:2-oxo acid dehydrogenase subunit E2 [Cryobacterium sp.]